MFSSQYYLSLWAELFNIMGEILLECVAENQ